MELCGGAASLLVVSEPWKEEAEMYELVQVSEKCYYINCPAKIGVYVPLSFEVEIRK